MFRSGLMERSPYLAVALLYDATMQEGESRDRRSGLPGGVDAARTVALP